MSIDTPTAPPQAETINGRVAPVAEAVATTAQKTPVPEAAEPERRHRWLPRRSAPKPVEGNDAPKPEQAKDKERREGVLPKAALFAIVPFFTLYYLTFFAGATVGQALVLSSPKVLASLPGDHAITIDFTTAAAIGGALEFASIGLMLFSLIVRIEGERGMVASGISYALAVVAIGLNSIGHLWIGDIFGAIVFTFCSLVAFISGGLMVEFFMRQIQRRRGMRAYAPPRYGVRLWWKDRDLYYRARAFFDEDPDLGLYGSLDAARGAREEERREEAREERRNLLRGLLRDISLEEFGNHEQFAEIYVVSNNPDEIVQNLMDASDSGKVAADIMARMESQRERANLEREQRIAAEIAAEFAGEPAPNQPHNNGSKIARMGGRIGKFVGLESGSNSNANGVPNQGPNGVSNNGRTGTVEPSSNGLESGANATAGNGDTMSLPRVEDGKKGREAAKAYIARLIAEGMKLPSGREIEEMFEIGTEYSNGGNGNALKRQVREQMEKRSNQ